MQSLEWFCNRIGDTVLVKIGNEWQQLTIKNELQAPWLHASQQFGFEYMAYTPVENVCVACEG